MVNIDASTPQLKAVKNLLDAYVSLDLKNTEPFLSKDFKFHTFPKIEEHPEETKGRHLEKYGSIFSAFTNLELIVHEVIEGSGKVVLHFTALITLVDGTKLDYDTVSIFTLVEEDGELKLLSFKDFSDHEKRGAFHAAVAKILAKQGHVV